MSWRNLIWMAVILALAGLSLWALADRNRTGVDRFFPAPRDPAVEDLSGAIQAYKLIHEHGYHELAPADASRGSIEGMIAQLHDFSAYIPPEKVDAFRRRTEGAVKETGLRIASESGKIVVVGVLPGSPADAAGVTGGWEILAIDGRPAAELAVDDARKLLLTPPAAVKVLFAAPDGKQTPLALAPAAFDVETVTGLVRLGAGKWLHCLDEEKGIYYLRIDQFVDRTPAELRDIYKSLDEPKAVILDLRNNPGGLLTAAVEVADRFVDSGLIVRTVTRDGATNYFAHAEGTYPEIPIVALVDANTASAAEIVAGTLQANGRAMLVGEKTFGKWSVQTTYDLGNGLGKIHLTTSEFFLPDTDLATQPAATTQPTTASQPATAPVAPGSPAAAASRPSALAGATSQPSAPPKREGLSPDFVVPQSRAAQERLDFLRLRAMVLPPVLAATTTSPATTQPAERENLKNAILQMDGQLAKAYKMLIDNKIPTTRPAKNVRRIP